MTDWTHDREANARKLVPGQGREAHMHSALNGALDEIERLRHEAAARERLSTMDDATLAAVSRGERLLAEYEAADERPAQVREVARMLAAHPRWRWRSGMGDVPGHHRLTGEDEADGYCADATPDLTDGPTAGALLAMLDELGAVYIAEPHSAGPIRARTVKLFARDTGDRMIASGTGATHGEAFARTLLAAWGRE